MGSGTTGMAAKEEGFDFIGIEKDPEYFRIAEKRIDIIKFGIKHLKKKKQGFFF
jgi:site-specific DNA-methyltransferase (adenine-specific)